MTSHTLHYSHINPIKDSDKSDLQELRKVNQEQLRSSIQLSPRVQSLSIPQLAETRYTLSPSTGGYERVNDPKVKKQREKMAQKVNEIITHGITEEVIQQHLQSIEQ